MSGKETFLLGRESTTRHREPSELIILVILLVIMTPFVLTLFALKDALTDSNNGQELREQKEQNRKGKGSLFTLDVAVGITGKINADFHSICQ